MKPSTLTGVCKRWKTVSLIYTWKGDTGLKDLAGRNYREQMAAIKAEIARQEERLRALLEQG